MTFGMKLNSTRNYHGYVQTTNKIVCGTPGSIAFIALLQLPLLFPWARDFTLIA